MSPTTPDNPLANLSLGQATEYPAHYDATLLQAVPRALNREPIGVDEQKLPFFGVDEWTAYELSWLNANGLPQVAIGQFLVPVDSPSLIESKSFKLYLNSYNQTCFSTWHDVQQRLAADLSRCAGKTVTAELFSLQDFAQQPIAAIGGELIDNQDIAITDYDYNPAVLRVDDGAPVVQEVLSSDLLKSNCLITNQPDWGSVLIDYRGPQINRESLLRYLVSFRSHNEFHEQCVERIFQDLRHYCQCQMLSITARYTRRGGLDINPTRSTEQSWPQAPRGVRQ